jgi:hypothetical protein
MSWGLFNSHRLPDFRKKYFWDAHCPYKVDCPSHKPEPHSKPPKLKFVQKVSPMVDQYRCGYCGCLVNLAIFIPDDDNQDLKQMNPSLFGGKADYKFKNV